MRDIFHISENIIFKYPPMYDNLNRGTLDIEMRTPNYHS